MSKRPRIDHNHAHQPPIGVVLTNLGTPDAPTATALRRYLKEFLWDPRVVDLPRPLWWLILNGIILRTRPAKSAANYQKVWAADGSPLLLTSEAQRAALQVWLENSLGRKVVVALGMRYGNPSLATALAHLRAEGVRHLLILPLYPQYCDATTASTFDAVAAALKGERGLPELRMVHHYHDHPRYIAALAESVKAQWAETGRAQRLLFSFHGTPERYLHEGDPYFCECQKSARLVAEALDLEDHEWLVAFQSRFGKEPWLQPYTDETLRQLPRQGVKHLDILCPGFSADCLETLEEIAGEGREIFLHAGGEQYHYIPALNARAHHIEMMGELLLEQMHGWGLPTPQECARLAAERQERATELGAPH